MALNSGGEEILRGKWEKGDKEIVLEVLKADCEVRTGRQASRSLR